MSDLQEACNTALAEGRREAIFRLQAEMLQDGVNLGADYCPVEHFFAEGSYGRQITMPKGLVVVGKIHKHSHVNVISQGHVMVFTEHDGLYELKAPCTFVSKPGTKRVVLMLEETIWTTVHVTTSTNLADIEREVIEPEVL